MTVEIRLMRETIDQQYAEIAKLNRNIEALNHQIRKKDEENARLKERLSKYEKPKKNSSNSSTPPSKDRHYARPLNNCLNFKLLARN